MGRKDKKGDKMKINVAFSGRLSGALGITYNITDTVECKKWDFEAANLALFEGRTGSGKAYEWVNNLKLNRKAKA